MEHIIQQITEQYVKKFLEHFESRGIYDLGEMAKDGLEMAKGLMRDLLTAVVESSDQALVAAKAKRREDGTAIHERDVERTQFTSLGPFTYRRTYFQTATGKAYLLDGILGVREYDRVDTTVSAAMVNQAGSLSFQRSAGIVTGGHISRQTAWRKAMGTGEVALLPGRAREQPESLHIFADEDHVHLQNGRSTILPLVTVCAGKRNVSGERNALIEPAHVNGYGLRPDLLWEYVYALCEAKYDMGSVKEIFIYGDGAAWIGKSEDCFPGAVRVLDDYHYRKRMTSLAAGGICKEYAPRLHSAVRSDDRKRFLELLQEMEDKVAADVNEKARRKRLKALKEDGAYILKHWDAIQNMGCDGAIGSCTEALVSHVFSERFSRNPMGWSKAGLEKMTMIRVFIKNGGKVTPLDIGLDKRCVGERRAIRGCVDKYAGLVNAQTKEIFKDVRSWKWFGGGDGMISQARSGTRQALRLLGKTRNIC